MMTDPIADMLTRIRNAVAARQREVAIPYSKIKIAIAEILRREGYVENISETKDAHRSFCLKLKYAGREPAIRSIVRISTPGHRHYAKYSELKPVLNGLGHAILSTPRGIVTDIEARRQKVGGEVLCEIY